MSSTRNKVFGLGFQKTATTSLEVMLNKLGYKVAGYYQFRHIAKNSNLTRDQLFKHAIQTMQQHDAAKDTPWPIFYRELDATFPNAKFIHIERDPEEWISSVVGDFGDYPNNIHNLIYGVPFPKGNESIWLERYNEHNSQVKNYFRGRNKDFISLKLKEEFSMKAVCEFLGHPVINIDNPVANTKLKKKIKVAWWKLIGKD